MFKKAGKGFKRPYCINPACSRFVPEDQRGYVKKKNTETAEEGAESAEAADGAEDARDHRALGKGLDAFNEFVAGIDGNAGSRVGKLAHGKYLE